MAFPQWPKQKREEGVKNGLSEEFFQLVGSEDKEAIVSAVERLKEICADLPRSGRSLDASSREFVIPIISHEQKEMVLEALYDLSIFPWEEDGQIIIEKPRDLLKLRAAGFEPESLPIISIPSSEASTTNSLPSEVSFPLNYPETLSETFKRQFAPNEYREVTQSRPKEISEEDEISMDPGIDTELDEIINRFDEGRIDENDIEFRKRVGVLPTLSLFPHTFIWEKGKLHEKRTGREISKEEQQVLFQKAHDGDEDAITSLVRINTGLVLKVVARYVEKFGGNPDDLFQEGMIGLLKAIHKHEEARGSFSTYAMLMIESQVRRRGYEDKQVIRRPVYIAGQASQLRKAKEKVSVDGELRPKDVFDEIPEHRMSHGPRKESKIPANGIGLDRLERLYYLNAAFNPVSLDEGNLIDQELQPHGFFENNTDTEDHMSSEDLKRLVSKTLLTLTPREERVLRMRFGIPGDEDKTLEQVGDQMEVTRARIQQIEAKALRKLKHPSRSRALLWLLKRPLEIRKEDEYKYYPHGF